MSGSTEQVPAAAPPSISPISARGLMRDFPCTHGVLAALPLPFGMLEVDAATASCEIARFILALTMR
jgi:hypothetical protein